MHQNATSAIKWEGKISEQFPVIQGVWLGGILSADLCKLYINPLLERLENSQIGSRIGNVLCNASACADDIALMSRTDSDIQIQINMTQIHPTISLEMPVPSQGHYDFFRNACTKSGALRFSQFSGC